MGWVRVCALHPEQDQCPLLTSKGHRYMNVEGWVGPYVWITPYVHLTLGASSSLKPPLPGAMNLQHNRLL